MTNDKNLKSSKPRGKRFSKFRKSHQIFILSLPGLLFLLVFNYIPFFSGLILPFKNYRYDLGFLGSPWAGFDNFKFLFQSDAAWRITRNTVGLNLMFISVLLLCSVVCALMLNELTKKWVKPFQTVLFFPNFLSWVVISYIFIALFDMDYGFINSILQFFGLDPVLWYNEAEWWPGLLTIASTWKNLGYHVLIYYAALIGINSEYYEAAELDGANKLQKIWYISLPLIKTMIIMMVLLQIGKIFNGNFDMIYNLTRDSQLLYPTTDVIDTFVYRALRSTGDIGMASAAGMYQSVVGFIMVILANWTVRKIDKDSAMF